MNIGIIGASLEFPVSDAWTVGPAAFANHNLNYLMLGVKGNYYFDEWIGLSAHWDVYGGLNLGYAVALNDSHTSDLAEGLQVGGRCFWNDKWGVYLEIGGGTAGAAQYGVGVTAKL